MILIPTSLLEIARRIARVIDATVGIAIEDCLKQATGRNTVFCANSCHRLSQFFYVRLIGTLIKQSDVLMAHGHGVLFRFAVF